MNLNQTKVNQSNNKINLNYLFIMISLLMQSLSAIFGKLAAVKMDKFTFENITTNYYYLLSIICLGLQAITWQLVLRKFPLFWSYLFMSGIYILILIFSHFIFHETITQANIIGTIIIITGIIILTIGAFKTNV